MKNNKVTVNSQNNGTQFCSTFQFSSTLLEVKIVKMLNAVQFGLEKIVVKVYFMEKVELLIFLEKFIIVSMNKYCSIWHRKSV